MAHPHGASKPQTHNRCPGRPENREHLPSLTSQVLHLNLPFTGSKAQLFKRLQNAFKPTWKKAGWLRPKKYQQTISYVATKFNGLSWLTYDEQFRCRVPMT